MPESVVVAVITIRRTIDEGGDAVDVYTEDEVGEPLGIVDALGMLRFAEGVVLREHNGEDDEAEGDPPH